MANQSKKCSNKNFVKERKKRKKKDAWFIKTKTSEDYATELVSRDQKQNMLDKWCY